MATVHLVLLLLAAVLVSSILDQIIPKVTAPLIQIALGIIIAIVAQGAITIDLDADIFLVIFIAPLLFHEAQVADKTSLWKNKRSLLSYAIGLVVVIMIVVGFSLHAIIPSWSLAACFALGAALGPTDAVAVASVSKGTNISDRQKAILQGESLLNDASGIVSFQFAIAAAVTGAWEVGSAVGDFAIEFFGGIALGIIVGMILNFVVKTVREWGLDNTTFHVLLEVLTPFLVYLLADAVHVSGVLCVVACGIVLSVTPSNLGPTDSRLNIVSTSVWRVLAYGLNGIVFVLLGTQLPNVFTSSIDSIGVTSSTLIGLVFAITLIMHAVRFVWSIGSELLADRREGTMRSSGERLRSALITTLSGAKGTITLAIMFTIPTLVDFEGVGTFIDFPNRDMLIFLASGTILLSLLLATYVVPLLAPKKETPEEQNTKLALAKVEIMRRVIERLTARETDETRAATSEVIRQYNDRIARIQNESDLEEEPDTELRIRMLQWQQEYLWTEIDAGRVPAEQGYDMLTHIARYEGLLKNDKTTRASLLRRMRKTTAQLRGTVRRALHKTTPDALDRETRIMRKIQINIAEYAIERLQAEMAESDIATESYSRLILEQQGILQATRLKGPSVTAYTQIETMSEDVRARALRYELEEIDNAYDSGDISRAQARELRRNVSLMQIDLDDHV